MPHLLTSRARIHPQVTEQLCLQRSHKHPVDIMVNVLLAYSDMLRGLATKKVPEVHQHHLQLSIQV